MSGSEPVLVVGAGVGGLVTAIDLAARGVPVTVVEKAPLVGGKMREVALAGRAIDCGPTVFTMRWVFDELFSAADAHLDDYLRLTPLAILARHSWDQTGHFDLYADQRRSADAVGRLAGAAEAKRFLAFCAEAKAIYQTLQRPFLAATRPNPIGLARRIGLSRPAALLGIRPFESLWGALGSHFHDPRLRQLFGRYATYNGSSPFLAPATLMLIAHVEQEGVWAVEGGMQRLAEALERLARERGVTFRLGASVSDILVEGGRASAVLLSNGERLAAAEIVLNADAAALAGTTFGAAVAGTVPPIPLASRSLSAVTWALQAQCDGVGLARHTVFFSRDYRAEFDELMQRRRLPSEPTVYICAQDRLGDEATQAEGDQRLFLLINAPSVGDATRYSDKEIAACESRVMNQLSRCGLSLRRQQSQMTVTQPADFHQMFPATGGALYGRASHGWRASFQRPGARTRIAGLYLAGGSTHPGAGVPMAALSGRLAAQQLIADRDSTSRSRRAAISGGISTG